MSWCTQQVAAAVISDSWQLLSSLTLGGSLEGIAWPASAKLLTLGAKPGADIDGSRQPLRGRPGSCCRPLRPASDGAGTPLADPSAKTATRGSVQTGSPLLGLRESP